MLRIFLVGVQGFEPWTPWSQTRCATRLRHTPNEIGGDGWSRTSSAEAADLQSTGVTNFPTSPIWSNELDLNQRLYGFAIRCIGPLCHRCIYMALRGGIEPLLTDVKGRCPNR